MPSINQDLFARPCLRPSWCFKVVHGRFCPKIRNEIITYMNVTKERKITVAVTADPLQRLIISLYVGRFYPFYRPRRPLGRVEV
jgi:hypothetical protein